ncbi:hypothetical protein HK097_009395 [Rhizophlyctis rosea]|uniref:Uncharacterized protein n=1 Tax=Rhizophlyctis rosea TaxID=64517 RepID=A0AAD5X3A0_9FUNG|nr:hypothetical protein HK097_009395 [Rhizophlyctis rosea]
MKISDLPMDSSRNSSSESDRATSMPRSLNTRDTGQPISVSLINQVLSQLPYNEAQVNQPLNSVHTIHPSTAYPVAAPRSPLPTIPRSPITPAEECTWARDVAEEAMREYEARAKKIKAEKSSLEREANANTMGKDSGVDINTLRPLKSGRKDEGLGPRRSSNKKTTVIYISPERSPALQDRTVKKKDDGEGAGLKRWARYRMFRKYSMKKRSFFTSVAATRKGKGKETEKNDIGRDDGSHGWVDEQVDGGFDWGGETPIGGRLVALRKETVGRNRSLSAGAAMNREVRNSWMREAAMYGTTPRGGPRADGFDETAQDGLSTSPEILVNGLAARDNGAATELRSVDPLYRTHTWNQRGALEVRNMSTMDNRNSVVLSATLVEPSEGQDEWIDEYIERADVPRQSSTFARRVTVRDTKLIRTAESATAPA